MIALRHSALSVPSRLTNSSGDGCCSNPTSGPLKSTSANTARARPGGHLGEDRHLVMSSNEYKNSSDVSARSSTDCSVRTNRSDFTRPSKLLGDLMNKLEVRCGQAALEAVAAEIFAYSQGHGWYAWMRRAHLFGIKSIQFAKIDPLDATLCMSNGAYRVIINSARPRSRQLFSLAHELAHVALERHLPFLASDMKNRSLFAPDFDREEEELADALAARMLMPDRLVHSIAHDYGCGTTGIWQVSRAFSVSVQAAARRIAEVSAERIACLLFNSEHGGQRIRFDRTACWALSFPERILRPWVISTDTISLQPIPDQTQIVQLLLPVAGDIRERFECEARWVGQSRLMITTTMHD